MDVYALKPVIKWVSGLLIKSFLIFNFKIKSITLIKLLEDIKLEEKQKSDILQAVAFSCIFNFTEWNSRPSNDVKVPGN